MTMTTIADLLAHLAARGVTVEARGDKLRIDAPVGALTPAARAALAERKAEVLAHLAGAAQPTPTPTPAPPEIVRIPLSDLSDYLAEHGLCVVGGTRHFGGAAFRPVLYLAETTAQEVNA